MKGNEYCLDREPDGLSLNLGLFISCLTLDKLLNPICALVSYKVIQIA